MRIKKVKVRTESRHGDDEPIIMVDEDGVWETAISDMKCVQEERIRYGTTAMTVREDEVIIDGAGELKSHIVLRPDGRVYETSFESADIGSLVMGIQTHHLRTERMDDGMVIEIGYDLTHQELLVNKVEIVITVTGAEA